MRQKKFLLVLIVQLGLLFTTELHAFRGGGARRLRGHAPVLSFVAGSLGAWSSNADPYAVAISPSGDLYVSDSAACAIYKIPSGGTPKNFAGLPGTCGVTDGKGVLARFNNPRGVALDSSGNLYVADYGNHTIRKITSMGVVTTLAGLAGTSGTTDGTGSAANFYNPIAVALDSSGNIYVADNGNHTIRLVTSAGLVTTFAGTAGTSGSADGTGIAATFNLPGGVAVDSLGNVYVADTGNNEIRMITPAGVVTTLAGSGPTGSTDGTGAAARFSSPKGLAVDSSGNIYVADSGNNAIRMVTSAGVVTTFAGGVSGNMDGTGATSKFNSPTGLAVDSSGNIYAADNGNHTLRIVTQAGAVTTLQGTTEVMDGVGLATNFDVPIGMAIDSFGDIYLADYGNHTIRKVTSAGVVTTFAGLAGFSGNTDGTGSAARFFNPAGLAFDSSGNLIVTDYGNHTIRKITSAGVVTTLAGLAGTFGIADGTGSAATFRNPYGVALDASGNIFVSDMSNCRIRKVTSAGVVTTFAGGVCGSSVDGTGTAARFNRVGGIAIASSGNMYVTDSNGLIRKITAAAVVTALAGSAGSGYVDATGSAAKFNTPKGLAVDSSENIYVADSGNHVLRKVTSGGGVTTLAGSAGFPGFVNGTGSGANFRFPGGVMVNSSGNIFVTDQNDVVRKVTSAGVVTTFAGSSSRFIEKYVDSVGALARFNSPTGLTVDTAGNIYVADYSNSLIRRINPNGAVTTLAGLVKSTGRINGTGAAALFYYPAGVTVDSSGNVFVVDRYNHEIRKVTSAGVVTLFAGSAAGLAGYTDATGTTARFSFPRGAAIDSSGNIYVADLAANTIRKITSAAVVTTFAGTAATSGSADGTGAAARFKSPAGVAVDSGGNVYVADYGNHTIRMITSAGVVTTLAGSPGLSGSGDGTGAAARFNSPSGVAVDSSGNIYVADSGNNCIRKVTSAGVVTTFAGSSFPGAADGMGTAARFNNPSGIAVDSSGNIYVADSGNNAIRKITPAGAVVTLAGVSQTFAGSVTSGSGVLDGTKSLASFNNPSSFVTDTAGNIYLTDTFNHSVRKVTPSGVTTTFAGTAGVSGSADGTGTAAKFSYPSGISMDSSGNLYVSDSYNHTIRKVTSAGVVTTLAGSAGVSGTADGTGNAARFNRPQGLRIDSVGNIFVIDTENHTIRKVTSAGVVTTFAGTAATPGSLDGTGTGASFAYPSGVVIDTSDNLFVTDTGNGTIRKITSAGVVTTFTGAAGIAGFTDGVGAAARFNWPKGITIDTVGNLYVADVGNNVIRKISPSAKVGFGLDPNELPSLSRKHPVILSPSLNNQQTAFGVLGAVHVHRGLLYMSLGNQIYSLPAP